ncbi:MAG: hypothetical protein U0559_08005 [Anaerolineae bacterium]
MEIYDYLRLLYARVGTPHCPVQGREVQMQTPDQIIDAVAAMPEGRRIQILAPLIKDRKGHHQQVFEDIRKAGYVRLRASTASARRQRRSPSNSIGTRTTPSRAVVDRLIIKADLNAAPRGFDRNGAAPGRWHRDRQRRYRQRTSRSHLQRKICLPLRRQHRCLRSELCTFLFNRRTAHAKLVRAWH